jgi:hypothetical protein
MNAKILYAATVALALASGLALADEGQPLSREQVAAAWNQAAADGTLRHNDYDYDKVDARIVSSRTRDEVVAEMAASRPNAALVGPLRNRTYNPAGMEVLRVSTLPRAEVKAEVVAAVRDGTLRHSDYDDLPVRIAHRVTRNAAPVVAGTSSTLSTGI